MVGIFVMWLVFAGVVGWVASERDRSPVTWGLLSLLLSPLIGLIALIAAGDGDSGGSENQSPQAMARDAQSKRTCKRDGEKEFPSDTAHCPHCGDVINAEDEMHPRVG